MATAKGSNAEIAELLRRYDRIAEIIGSLTDPRAKPFLNGLESGLAKIQEILSTDPDAKLRRRIALGLRQGLRDLPHILDWAPDDVVEQIRTAVAQPTVTH